MTASSTPGLLVRLSVTDGCGLRCLYCKPAGSASPPRTHAPMSVRKIRVLLEKLVQIHGIAKVRITGGEPLLRSDLPEIISGIREMGIPDIALTTNGQQLARQARVLRDAGLDRVNVSLDSLETDTFSRITGGGDLDRVLLGIERARACGLTPVRVNMVLMRGINDHEAVEMVRFGLRTGCTVRFLELMPIGAMANDFQRLLVPWEETHERVSSAFDLEALPHEAGETSRDFLVRDGDGTGRCGFISPSTKPFCAGCRRLRVTAGGELIGCLANPRRIPLGAALDQAMGGDNKPLERIIASAFRLKRGVHALERQYEMSGIGG